MSEPNPMSENTLETMLLDDKTIKILAIGNSFSWDAMEHLGGILNSMGYKVYLGKLHVDSCSLDMHWNHICSDAEVYQYWTCPGGEVWTGKMNYKLSSALKAKDWDIITVQQASSATASPDNLKNLQNILNYITANKTNPDAHVYWHFTWAYQKGFSGLSSFNNDQMTMYGVGKDLAKNQISKYDEIVGVIPSGTTIQNLRTSYLGDTLNRDGYHLTLDIGRYAVALTWASVLTGESIDGVSWIPSKYPEVGEHLDLIKQAVKCAIDCPYDVTNLD